MARRLGIHRRVLHSLYRRQLLPVRPELSWRTDCNNRCIVAAVFECDVRWRPGLVRRVALTRNSGEGRNDDANVWARGFGSRRDHRSFYYHRVSRGASRPGPLHEDESDVGAGENSFLSKLRASPIEVEFIRTQYAGLVSPLALSHFYLDRWLTSVVIIAAGCRVQISTVNFHCRAEQFYRIV